MQKGSDLSPLNKQSIELLRERVANQDERLETVEKSLRREIDSVRQNLNTRIDSFHVDLIKYVDQRFGEIAKVRTVAPSSIEARLWIFIVITGLVIASVFIILTLMMAVQNWGIR